MFHFGPSPLQKDYNTDLSNTRAGVGYVENGNTASNTIAKGKYVFWKGRFKKATSAIPSGTTLSNSNLSDVSGGLGAEVAALSDQMATIDSNTVAFWTTLSTYSYQNNYYAQVYGNFKGKTLTLTAAVVYNGSSSYNILSTTTSNKVNDFCINISTSSASVGGTLFYVTFSVS